MAMPFKDTKYLIVSFWLLFIMKEKVTTRNRPL
jgi:hypothetical protein